MNVADTINFISQGGKFTEHSGLAVTALGGIVNSGSGSALSSLPCPLLSGLYELGAPNALRESDLGHSADAADSFEADSEGRFDAQFSWKNMEELMAMIGYELGMDGECASMAKGMDEQSMRTFVLNFYQMTDIIGHEWAQRLKEEDEAGIDNDYRGYRPDPESADYKKYLFSTDGEIYETSDYAHDDGREHFRCRGIETILNDIFILDENLSYTNVKIAIEELFPAWYSKLLEDVS